MGRKTAAPAASPAKPNGDTNRTLTDIELALADEYGWKRNVIAFNVNGLSATLPLGHECDMLVVTKSGYLTEIEIKRSWSDFRAEFRKRHRHTSSVPMKDFVFCIPEGILDKVISKLQDERVVPTEILTYDESLRFTHLSVSSAPDNPVNRDSADRLRRNAGHIVLLLEDNGKETIRIADPNRRSQPLFIEQQLEVARLGAMRQVSLREKLLHTESELKRNPDAALQNRITELEILLREYRTRYKEETGNDIDEKETLYG